jgi:hypothetical protein
MVMTAPRNGHDTIPEHILLMGLELSAKNLNYLSSPDGDESALQ